MADQDPLAASDASGPRMEHDLRAIREARDLSLDALQRETRMPSDILRRFEAGELVGDANYNEVYLRNLLKSYAQALDLSPQELNAAYEATRGGVYDGSLRQVHLEGGKEAPPPKPPPKPKPAASSGTAPAVAALSEPSPKKKEAPPPVTERTAAHMPKRRVQTAKAAASTASPIEKSWGVIMGGTIAAVVLIGVVLWFLFRDPSPEPEIVEAPPAPADTAQVAAPVDTPVESAPANAPTFQTPIQLTVTATDEPLENFRVQVDGDARRPHWVEPGQSTSFTAQQRITVWGEVDVGVQGGGEYDGAVLQLQGIEWTPPDGQVVRISAQRGQAVLDSLARATRIAR